MKIDTIPTHRITAEAMEHSIFTGTKFCFVNIDMVHDWSWDGTKLLIDWDKKADSVLFSEKELKAFRSSDTVHNFLLSVAESRREEIAELKKKVRTAKTHWEHSRYPGMRCNPKQQLKDRITFLEDNEVRFVEIKFVNIK